MRGRDCTPEQLDRASDFLAKRGWQEEAEKAIQLRADMVRLIAWYGALRYQAGEKGIATLKNPGVATEAKGKS